ncbi:hypothetical protein [Immundisolibacter sp.]|uniref:hypothetical protein n=1 Tax=Immundisolibacter sp. TaxID=1934948 RepID=UPI003F8624FC
MTAAAEPGHQASAGAPACGCRRRIRGEHDNVLGHQVERWRQAVAELRRQYAQRRRAKGFQRR